MLTELSADQIERYARHLILSEVGLEGQQKISQAKVLVIGAGGLGSPVLLYLAAAGVGTLGVVDPDVVDLSNLQRQVIHFTSDVNRPKVESARQKIAQLNPHVKVIAYPQSAKAENIENLIQGYDFIVDATDNFPAKFLINDACVLGHKPFSHAGVLKFVGQTMTVIPGKSACYRCVFQEPPPAGSVPTCTQTGILGAIAGVLGTLQATEVLKFIVGRGDLLTDRLMIFDALEMAFRNVKISKHRACPVCGQRPRIRSLIDSDQTRCDWKR